ncbi:hypothetical protein GCM10023205_25500 [Yinghuangia aomiensis]|uniref:Uncharacterized protein n=1 Tax=Yinghuangia aomiensis TaxID=676205 RepID=A0ABP9H313_9ACTN
MRLVFVAVDEKSGGGNCPTVWVDEDAGELVFQGWDALPEMLEACRATGPVPDGESVVRLPVRMADAIRRACDLAESCDVR